MIGGGGEGDCDAGRDLADWGDQRLPASAISPYRAGGDSRSFLLKEQCGKDTITALGGLLSMGGGHGNGARGDRGASGSADKCDFGFS